MSDQQVQQPIFQIEKIYVKDMSLEVPNAPSVYLEATQPEVEMQIHTEAQPLDEGFFESTVTVTVTAKAGDKTHFLVEVAQAGIFQLRNIPNQDLEPLLAVSCPNILFPYVRETVSDVVSRAGFPPILLAPINFEALYVQRQAQQADAQEAPATIQ
ncbi:protein-export chaperone SecB [Burkholderiaceae bacterium DAT-1]|nr:protein-export chaperone SecB [Burkholderiaceae bacterium DAT-1]